MKFGPVTRFDKGSTTTSKKFADNVMPENCYVIVNFTIYGQFGAVGKPNSRCMICKTYIFIQGNLLSYKNWNRTKTFSTHLSYYCFESKSIILIFLKLHMGRSNYTPFTPQSETNPKKANQIRVNIDPLQLFLKSYKNNCVILIFCNKAQL